MDKQEEQRDLVYVVANPDLVRANSAVITKGDADEAMHRAKIDEAFVCRMMTTVRTVERITMIQTTCKRY